MIAKQFIHPIRIFIINKNYYIQWENSKEQTFVSYKHKFPENPIFNLNYKQHKNPIFPQRKKKKNRVPLFHINWINLWISGSTRESREATTWSNKRRARDPFDLFKRTTRIRTNRSRRVQASPENPSYGEDRMLCFLVWRTWRPELFAESYVAVQSFFSGDEPIGPKDLIFDCFDAKSAYPTALITLTDAGDVSGSTLLCETTWVAFYTLDLELKDWFGCGCGCGCMRIWACNGHGLWPDNIELSIKTVSL